MAINGAANGTGGEQLVGIAEQVNDKGVKIAGEWRNFSKFATDMALSLIHI